MKIIKWSIIIFLFLLGYIIMIIGVFNILNENIIITIICKFIIALLLGNTAINIIRIFKKYFESKLKDNKD